MKYRIIFSCFLLFSFVMTVTAWNKPGHMVTGAIAARDLKTKDQVALAQAVRLLKQHPAYRRSFSNLPPWFTVAGQRARIDDEAVVLFALAARWPDDARNTAFHCGPCHYVNYPFKPDGQPASIQVRNPRGQHIENVFERNLVIIRNSRTPDVQKAVALAWLFHLAGDAHQPLHSSALFTTQFADGDSGGNEIYVRFAPKTRAFNLHSVWDGLVLGSEGFQDVHNTYLELANRIKKENLDDVEEDDLPDWIQESFRLAKEKSYLNGTIRGGVPPRCYRMDTLPNRRALQNDG